MEIFMTLFAFWHVVFVDLIAPIFYEPDLAKYENRWTGKLSFFFRNSKFVCFN